MGSGVVDDDDAECAMKFKWTWLEGEEKSSLACKCAQS